MTPNSGKAIGLQLDPNLKLISFSFVHAALKRLHTGQDPEQVLHMVANFVCDDVRLRELATLASQVTSTAPLLEILEELRVEIQLLVNWAVERTHRRLGVSTSRLHGARKHDERWGLISSSRTTEYLFPLDFRASENS